MSPAGSGERKAPDAAPERTARYDVHLDAERRVRWRMVAPNGRVIARSARGHASAETCRAELDGLRARIAGLRPLMGRADGGRGWCWSLAVDGGVVVALSARTYERLESCQISYDRFVRALTTVPPGDGW
ncbi:hypothetical protein [Yinghuangia seranimata]|uniref:hypothetical protein n=1 Tax=Yinghuangia seranimata TaxID=408067 RepID=UPI00248BDD39|nr:hypothetical protein [Yinghuangia seranimata]MDI2132875.1 hypothetical protein [Yinghuangia seranimata]